MKKLTCWKVDNSMESALCRKMDYTLRSPVIRERKQERRGAKAWAEEGGGRAIISNSLRSNSSHVRLIIIESSKRGCLIGASRALVGLGYWLVHAAIAIDTCCAIISRLIAMKTATAILTYLRWQYFSNTKRIMPHESVLTRLRVKTQLKCNWKIF